MPQKYIAIIFDDGPREPMRQMTDKIAAYGWTAGFAIIGNKINDETQNQLQYAIELGFELVSHSQNHVDLTTLQSSQEISNEIMCPINEVKKRLHYDITMARLPYLTGNDLVFKTCTELGVPLLGQGIRWAEDWLSERTPEMIAKTVLDSVCDGAVACLHVTENTCAALDIILPEFKKREYILVTASELFKIKNINQIPLGISITNVNRL